MIKISDFDYALPKELIAAYPPKDRTSARLLAVKKHTGQCSHHQFQDIGRFLRSGDLLVLNNTKVLPARLFGRKRTGGGVEALLLKQDEGNRWEALVRPSKRVKKGCSIVFSNNGTELKAQVLDERRANSGQRLIEFEGETVREKLWKIGHIPLPPYLDREDSEIDREMYQTVFAEKEGAVASPTAGLHFDEVLLQQLKDQGVEIAFVTLHVSYGTFQPISIEDPTRHQMEEETYEVSEDAAYRINRALKENRRVIACGTTMVRTLESVVNSEGEVQVGRGRTRLFIYPPYEFKIVKGLITNFHLPKSSLLLLVSSFFEESRPNCPEKLLGVYREAICQAYRFYSYGDAMIILED